MVRNHKMPTHILTGGVVTMILPHPGYPQHVWNIWERLAQPFFLFSMIFKHSHIQIIALSYLRMLTRKHTWMKEMPSNSSSAVCRVDFACRRDSICFFSFSISFSSRESFFFCLLLTRLFTRSTASSTNWYNCLLFPSILFTVALPECWEELLFEFSSKSGIKFETREFIEHLTPCSVEKKDMGSVFLTLALGFRAWSTFPTSHDFVWILIFPNTESEQQIWMVEMM